MTSIIRNAFTVIEVVVVITVIAVLAVMFIPRLAEAEEDTRVVAAAEDISGMVAAFEYYKTANGYWPPDTEAGEMPPEMRSSFKNSNPFDGGTPIGGVYNYDNHKDSPMLCITISGTEAYPAPTLVDALMLDSYMDDGNLMSGNFRSTEDGYSYAFHSK